MNEINGRGFVVKWIFLFYFDFICGIVLDYMYCVLGIMKKLMILWFNKFYCNKLFNILRMFKVDSRLMVIKLYEVLFKYFFIYI